VEGSHEATRPYVPLVPLADIELQFPPEEPRRLHAVSRSGPRMEVVLETWGLNRQSRLASKHRQAASLGVGGSVDEAMKDEFCAGHAGYDAAGALLCVGVLMNVRLPYAACRLAKSTPVVTRSGDIDHAKLASVACCGEV